MSGASEASTALQSSQRHFDNDEQDNAEQQSETRFSKDSTDLLPEEKRPGHYVTRSLSFFDISDSSEVSGTLQEETKKRSIENGQPSAATHVSSREDSTVSTVRPFGNTTRLNSKTSDLSKTSKGTNLTESQIDRYMTAHYITPIKEDTTQHEAMSDVPLPGQALTTDNRHSRPISDFSFNDNYTLRQPNRLSGLTNASVNASLSGDRVLQTYNAMLQSMRQAEQNPLPTNKNNMDMDMSLISSAISPAHVPLNLSTAFEHPRPAPGIVTQTQPSPLNPHAETFHMAPAMPTSFSSPGNTSRKDRHVTLRPPSLKSSPLRSTFVPPSMYTPFPLETGTGKQRLSFPLGSRNNGGGWQRFGNEATSQERQPNVMITIKLRRRHGTKTASLPLPCPYQSSLNTGNGQTSKPPTPNFSRATSPSPFLPTTSQTTATTNTSDAKMVENDDEAFFLSLRHLYYSNLLGRSRLTRWLKRYLSARRLVGVKYVSDPLAAMMLGQEGELGLGAEQVATPSDEELMAGFLRPKKGRGGFAVVRWAWGLFAGGNTQSSVEATHVQPSFDKTGTSVQTTPVEMLGGHSYQQQTQDAIWPPLPLPNITGHIELEEGWAVRRIVAAAFMVLLATIAMVVIWTVVGVSPGGDRGGVLAGAGRRVQEAFLMGLLVLAIGCVEVAIWIGISWVVM